MVGSWSARKHIVGRNRRGWQADSQGLGKRQDLKHCREVMSDTTKANYGPDISRPANSQQHWTLTDTTVTGPIRPDSGGI